MFMANMKLLTLETWANGKRQMRRNHGHMVTSAVCRLPET